MDRRKISKSLSREFRELDRAYLNLLGSQEQKLTASYRTALKSIKEKISQVYEQYGDKPTITELRKYNRLQSIEASIIKRLNELEKELKIYISKQRKTALIISKKDTAYKINKAFGVNFSLTKMDEKAIIKYLDDTLWIDALKTSTNKLFIDIKREFETVLRANSKEEIISGALEGKSLREVIKSIQGRFAVSYNRAKVISWTETHKLYSIGRNEAITEAIETAKKYNLKAYKVWRHNGIGEPRPDHLKADGQKANEDGMFYVGGEELEAPGLGTDPANNINCHCTVDFVVDID